MQILLSSLVPAKPGELPNFGRGLNAPENVNDYLGRLVNCCESTYIVTRVEPSEFKTRNRDGSLIPGMARLFIAKADSDDGRPIGHWVESVNVAAPGLTILNWNYRTDAREPAELCESLYLAATAAEEARQAERQQAHEERRNEEARCEQLWREHTPEWAKGCLVAELRVNECDLMTDYFNYSIATTVLLGFSKTSRNNFAEMRKFAATFPDTAHLSGVEGIEHRENYSGGSGYYLGGKEGRYSGWTIRKRSLHNCLHTGGYAVIDFSHWLENNR